MRRLARILAFSLIIVIALGVLAGAWLYHSVAQSLPLLEGEVTVAGLSAPVAIERDRQGIPTVRGKNRLDVARALGFLHAQERFFQMDLMRRQAAGELAEILGEALVNTDRRLRLHQFRSRAEKRLSEAPAEEQAVLDAYTEGVNAGLAALQEKPFEYLFLRSVPAPWRPADSLLTLFAMYMMLNDESGSRESTLGVLYDTLPGELADFLSPAGTEWDAPLVGPALESGNIPGPDVYDLRQRESASMDVRLEHDRPPEIWYAGSNNWAVAGWRTSHGGALLANDMHLGISVPNIWYRALMEWSETRLIGVTLPGLPLMVVGSNTHMAWGFTNSGGDWSDLVIVETDPENPERYLTPNGYVPFETHQETIRVRDGEPRELEIQTTLWGPIIDHDHRNRPRALRWIAHLVEGVNLNLLNLEKALSLDTALGVVNRAGIPPQNFVCADREGHIGWTVAGMIPRRVGFDGNLPTSWADGTRTWEGWLDPVEYPRVVNPDSGVIWTANARVVDGDWLAAMGDGGYAMGARAKQIRDNLMALQKPGERQMLDVQLDDRAILLERWRELLLDVLSREESSGNDRRTRFRDLVENTWTGRASVDSVAYRLVRSFRRFTFEKVYGWLTADCREADERFNIYELNQWEGPLWKLVTGKPLHLLNPRYASWTEALLEAVDDTIDHFDNGDDRLLEDRAWGEQNTASIQHPLSGAVPLLSRWLDMPRQPLSGDRDMPRVQAPDHGASERLAVSPGREEEGIFHMPGGQSGHPLSSYYRAGHDDWAEGRPTPLVPGPTETVLTLRPAVEH
jgi:penicillin amidase